ncbi:MAG: 5'-methylthioadenosine/adenosylhomocysteine nucleosidase [Oscillospiraceae bacterium]
MDITGIIGAMDIEITSIVNKLENKTIENIKGQDFYKGTIKNKNVVVTCCGIGKVCASITTQILISEFKVSRVINTGIAGNMSDDLKIGDVVISTTVKYHDFDDDLLKMYYPFKTQFDADLNLISLCENAISNFKERKVKFSKGLIVTGDIFLEDSNLKQNIKNKFNPLCIDMESCAIGHCCKKSNIPFVAIRSISDDSEDNAEKIYETFKHNVADLSSSIVLSLMQNI